MPNGSVGDLHTGQKIDTAEEPSLPHFSRSPKNFKRMSAQKNIYVVIISGIFHQRLSCFIYALSYFSMESAYICRKRKALSWPSSTIMRATTPIDNEELGGEQSNLLAGLPNKSTASVFQQTTVADAKSLTDGFNLTTNKSNSSILPFIGYGTYKLGKETAKSKTLEALRQGYRCIDTAFIYGGETTEKQVGLAIQDAVDEGILKNGRQDLFLITKHWRKYHGYEPANKCLNLSLKRLQLNYIDLWLMHWPGPAWNSMSRRKDLIADHGPWYYAVHTEKEIPQLRAETWRAMEDAVRSGKVKAIGVCNFGIQHLERLKRTATIWPPSVNQIECHPLFPQKELVEYCRKEGIIVQAYSSLGGQDAGKKFWRTLYPPPKKRGKNTPEPVTKLSNTPPVLALAAETNRTSAQVLLRWGLENNFSLVPKTSSKERMIENSDILGFSLSTAQIDRLETELQNALTEAAKLENKEVESMARLCWRNDPLRDLFFE